MSLQNAHEVVRFGGEACLLHGRGLSPNRSAWSPRFMTEPQGDDGAVKPACKQIQGHRVSHRWTVTRFPSTKGIYSGVSRMPFLKDAQRMKAQTFTFALETAGVHCSLRLTEPSAQHKRRLGLDHGYSVHAAI